MPYKKKSSKPRRYRRRAARRTRKPKLTVSTIRSLSPLPSRYITKMKYSESFELAVSLGNPTPYIWTINSIFDPNRTGGGHQPYGHDTFATLYNRYRVISVSYVLNAVPTAGSTPIQVIAMPGNENMSGTGTLDYFRELPRCRYVTNMDGQIKTLRGKIYLPSVCGRTKNQYMADDRYQSTFGSDPAEIIYLNTFVGTMGSQSTTSFNVSYNMTLEFLVECFDVKTLAQS